MSDRENFQTIVDPPEDHAMVADSQALTASPLSLHGLDVSRAGYAKSRDRCKNA
jgi:hypothetical protein